MTRRASPVPPAEDDFAEFIQPAYGRRVLIRRKHIAEGKFPPRMYALSGHVDKDGKPFATNEDIDARIRRDAWAREKEFEAPVDLFRPPATRRYG